MQKHSASNKQATDQTNTISTAAQPAQTSKIMFSTLAEQATRQFDTLYDRRFQSPDQLLSGVAELGYDYISYALELATDQLLSQGLTQIDTQLFYEEFALPYDVFGVACSNLKTQYEDLSLSDITLNSAQVAQQQTVFMAQPTKAKLVKALHQTIANLALAMDDALNKMDNSLPIHLNLFANAQ